MFEIILGICLAAQPEKCRNVLIPGGEAQTIEACKTHLKTSKPDWVKQFPQYNQISKAECVETGKIAEYEKLADGVYAHRGIISDATSENLGDVSNAGFVVGETSVAVIDTGGSRKVAEQMFRAIRKITDLPISHVILTHMHPDHVLGASVFKDAGAKIIGHVDIERALIDRSEAYLTNFGGLIGAAEFIGTKIVVPDTTVDKKLSVDLGNRILEMRTWPRAHTSTDLTVTDVKNGIMFTGDLVFHEHAPALDGSLIGWQTVLQQMAKLKVKRIMPGHGGPVLAWPEATNVMLQYLGVLETDTRKAIKDGARLGEAIKIIAQSEEGNWQLFELFNPRNATVAYTELEWE